MHPPDTVSSQEFAVLLGRKQSISQLCLVIGETSQAENPAKCFPALIVNAQVPVLSAPGVVLVPTAAHSVVSMVLHVPVWEVLELRKVF